MTDGETRQKMDRPPGVHLRTLSRESVWRFESRVEIGLDVPSSCSRRIFSRLRRSLTVNLHSLVRVQHANCCSEMLMCILQCSQEEMFSLTLDGRPRPS